MSTTCVELPVTDFRPARAFAATVAASIPAVAKRIAGTVQLLETSRFQSSGRAMAPLWTQLRVIECPHQRLRDVTQ